MCYLIKDPKAKNKSWDEMYYISEHSMYSFYVRARACVYLTLFLSSILSSFSILSLFPSVSFLSSVTVSWLPAWDPPSLISDNVSTLLVFFDSCQHLFAFYRMVRKTVSRTIGSRSSQIWVRLTLRLCERNDCGTEGL